MAGQDVLALLAINFAVVMIALTCLWMVSVRLKDASIIDIAWGPACAMPAIATFMQLENPGPRAMLLLALVSLWALRLAGYLWRRNAGHGEDIRYQKMRADRGSDRAMAWWSLPNVYWLQGAVAWFVSLPVQLGQIGAPAAIGPLALLGALIFAAGLAFEAVGDWQLQRFKADPANKGKLMTSGLWSLTRHPNYFGDSLVWIGLTIIALEGGFGVWTIASPIVMTFFLVNISGKALTERIMSKKYPEYAAYVARVSGFIPMPRKKDANAPQS